MADTPRLDQRVMSSKKADLNAAKGRRYTFKEKQEIVDFVDMVNAEKGRGGQSAAAKKYKISPLTIGTWLRSGIGGEANGLATTSGITSAGPIGKKLEMLQLLHGQISRAEKDLAMLKTQFEALKRGL